MNQDHTDLLRRLRERGNMDDGVLTHDEDFIEAADAIEALQAENAALRKDAERYRLLRKSWSHPTPEQMDAYLDSIDDALLAGKEGK